MGRIDNLEALGDGFSADYFIDDRKWIHLEYDYPEVETERVDGGFTEDFGLGPERCDTGSGEVVSDVRFKKPELEFWRDGDVRICSLYFTEEQIEDAKAAAEEEIGKYIEENYFG